MESAGHARADEFRGRARRRERGRGASSARWMVKKITRARAETDGARTVARAQVALRVEWGGRAVTLRAPRSASLGGFLTRERAMRRVIEALGAPERAGRVTLRSAEGGGLEASASASALADASADGDGGAVTIRLDVAEDAVASIDGVDGWSAMERECRQSFFNSVKESTYATRASAARAMTMSSEDADALYEGAMRGDIKGLMRAEAVSAELGEGKKREVVPLRVYEVRERDFSSATFVSAPASVERRGTTVEEALRAFGVDTSAVRSVLSQGVEIDLNFDLAQTYESLRHVDGFLYLVVHVKGSFSSSLV